MPLGAPQLIIISKYDDLQFFDYNGEIQYIIVH